LEGVDLVGEGGGEGLEAGAAGRGGGRAFEEESGEMRRDFHADAAEADVVKGDGLEDVGAGEAFGLGIAVEFEAAALLPAEQGFEVVGVETDGYFQGSAVGVPVGVEVAEVELVGSQEERANYCR